MGQLHLGWGCEGSSMTSEFIVDGWSASGSTVELHYTGDEFSFTEVVRFPVEVDANDTVTRLLDLLCIVAGVSYAKAVAPATVSFPTLNISRAGMALVTKTYNEGMREFAFHNSLPLTSTFHIDDEARGEDVTIEALRSDAGIPLIPFGAGRDSCVVASALQHLNPTLFTIGDNPYAKRVAHQLGLTLLTASRTIDPLLLDLNAKGAPNGHIPVTAINSLISLIVAELTGHSSVVMANEKSASQATRVIDGIEVNHQFSKSLEFEMAIQHAVDAVASTVFYVSVLRNTPDQEISQAFATKCINLLPLFMSCNRAMVRNESQRSNGWCCECPKCRGMFLSLAPFLTPTKMSEIFGQDLLNDSHQISGFQDLMSDDSKPFECVADTHEAQQSMRALLTQEEWSQHVVVTACRDIAERSQPTLFTESMMQSHTLFGAEMTAFLETPQ